jgi:myo-inositol-1-phosphate synthase
MSRARIGVWFIGAFGGVGTTATAGLIALEKGLAGTAGLVSAEPRFAPLDLADWSQFVVGGHDIRRLSYYDQAMQLHARSGVFDRDVLHKCRSALERAAENVRPGTMLNVGSAVEELADRDLLPKRETAAEALARIAGDLESFERSKRLDYVIVVNIASTEPMPNGRPLPDRWPQLKRLLERKRGPAAVPSSTLYAIAALSRGYSYINFTPSLGSSLPALWELADERGALHMGQDGKTGETLLKSVLAPMFAARNLHVLSWVGHNIFGNLDGRVLEDPRNKLSKVRSKDHLLAEILGYKPQTHVSIEYIQSLDDWKTAWDHIHFEGFLGTKMALQFTWQGCDSLLAAPLVLDLVRFTEREWRRGKIGLMRHLASFFKSPLGVEEQDFLRQFQMLEQWAAEVAAEAGERVPARTSGAV